MKLSIMSKKFLNAVQMAGAASAARSTIPALTSLLLETRDDKLVVIGSDMEISVAYGVGEVEISRPGSCLIPASRLLTIARENDSDSLTINSDEKKTRVEFGRSKYDFNIQHVDTYPKPLSTNPEGKFWYTVPSKMFKEAVGRTDFAISANEGSKWNTTGAYFSQREDFLDIVCTDTKQLVYFPMTIENKQETPLSAIIPAKAVDIVTRNCEAGDTMKINLEKNSASFECGEWVLSTSVIAGIFPPYMTILTKHSPHKIELDVAEFTNTIRRGAIMLNTVSKRIDLVFADNRLTVETPGISEGNSSSSMPIKWDGEEVRIGLDATHVMSYLRTIQHADKVRIEFGKQKPMVMQIDGPKSDYLIMPMY